MTNKVFEGNELGKRLRLLNNVMFVNYALCLFLFILLYVQREAGRTSLFIALIPLFVMFAIMLVITKFSKFNPLFFYPHLGNNAEIARKFYVGRLILDDSFFMKNIVVLVIVLAALMFAIRLIV